MSSRGGEENACCVTSSKRGRGHVLHFTALCTMTSEVLAVHQKAIRLMVSRLKFEPDRFTFEGKPSYGGTNLRFVLSFLKGLHNETGCSGFFKSASPDDYGLILARFIYCCPPHVSFGSCKPPEHSFSVCCIDKRQDPPQFPSSSPR